ncbi:hypothetical protein ABE236_25335 [Priestia endophytica]|uniref:hypothetical protein n=1 Tax=Priestia endophytica TaxID=135735 RepID=UPI003D293AF5
MNNKFKIFFVMPFDTEFNDMYEHIKEVIEDESSDYEVFRADTLLNQQNILKDVVVSINESDLIIADLTDLNANVFYELGLAHALRKNVVLLTQNIDELPFDLKSYRVIHYSNHFRKIRDLEENLKRLLKEIQKGQLSFGSPITDWIPLTLDNNIIQNKEVAATISTEITTPDFEKEIAETIEEEGFIDFIANVEESLDELTNNVTNISNATVKLNEDVTEQTLKINKVQQNGGAGTVSQMRKLARKTSSILNEYGVYLAKQNKEYDTNWNEFEEGLTNLFNTDLILKRLENDEEQFMDFLNSINSFKDMMYPARDGVESFVGVIKDIKGIESSMTRASMLIERELKEFMGLLDKSIAATERLYVKGVDILKRKDK